MARAVAILVGLGRRVRLGLGGTDGLDGVEVPFHAVLVIVTRAR